VGFAALRLGAEVTFADGSATVCAGVRSVLAANRLSATVVGHRWGDRVPGGPFAWMFGGDILYRPDCFRALFATLAASLAADGVALLADPRTQLEPELPSLAAAAGLSWQPTRYDGLTVVSVRRLTGC
jgi:hypothetical protein